MSIAINNSKFEHGPTLNTVIMVEETIKSINEGLFSVADIKRHLPKQVNHNTLKIILGYLEESNKIAVGIKGISWIHNNNLNLKKAISKGLEL